MGVVLVRGQPCPVSAGSWTEKAVECTYDTSLEPSTNMINLQPDGSDRSAWWNVLEDMPVRDALSGEESAFGRPRIQSMQCNSTGTDTCAHDGDALSIQGQNFGRNPLVWAVRVGVSCNLATSLP